MTILRAATPLAVLALCTLVATESFAQQQGFRIRKTAERAGRLVIYHEMVPETESASLSIRAGGLECKPDEGECMRSDKGGELLTTLIVLDRGGTSTSGMGRYSGPLLNGVYEAVRKALEADPRNRFAFVDSLGRTQAVGELPPTSEDTKILAFLTQRGAVKPESSGADIYTVTQQGLRLVDASDTTLKAIVIVSDGIDPDESAVGTKIERLIEAARQRNYTISAVHIDRSTERGRSRNAILKGQRGKSSLLSAVDATNGDFRTLLAYEAADAEKDRASRAAPNPRSACHTALCSRTAVNLISLGMAYGALARTTCALCGESRASQPVLVSMTVERDGSPYAASADNEAARFTPAQQSYGPCSGPAVAKVDPPKQAPPVTNPDPAPDSDGGSNGQAPGPVDPPVPGQPVPPAADADAECTDATQCDACDSCESGHCEAQKCSEDADCPSGQCTCDEGRCRNRKAASSKLPWMLSLLGAGVLLAGFGVVRSRSTKREATVRREAGERARREADERATMESQRRLSEQEARARELEAHVARESQQREAQLKALEEQQRRETDSLNTRINPVLYRLEGGGRQFELRSGKFVVGADRAQAQLLIDAPTISSVHAQLVVNLSGVWIVDLRSSNGTFVNGSRLPPEQSVELRPGDEVGFSQRALMTLRAAETPQAPRT